MIREERSFRGCAEAPHHGKKRGIVMRRFDNVVENVAETDTQQKASIIYSYL